MNLLNFLPDNNIQKLQEWYRLNYEATLKGRYIVFDTIFPLLQHLPSTVFKKEVLGYSSNNIPIYKITAGTGSKKILIWSQMHGNESTGTKSLFDLFRFLAHAKFKNVTENILSKCTLVFIPMLNPDGAILFTRENAQNIDLNRDAVNRVAPESNLLRNVLDTFRPEYCFNLHDQRTIFNVEGTCNPATLSFLAPSENLERTITSGRIETMQVIVSMNQLLQKLIPNQIGRYTDEFYPTATGDNFQKLGHNTILIESGHFKNDYQRDVTREYHFYALLQGIIHIANNYKTNYKDYFKIPNNDTKFLDVIYNNVTIFENGIKKTTSVGVQVKFKVKEGVLTRYEHIEKIGDLSNYFTYNYINAENSTIKELKLSNS